MKMKEMRKVGTLSGVRGHSNFTHGLTLRRVECGALTPPPASSSRSFLIRAFHPHLHPRGRPCYANSEIHPVQPLMNVRASCDNHRSLPTLPPVQYRTWECMTTNTWPMSKSGTFPGWGCVGVWYSRGDRIKSPSSRAFHLATHARQLRLSVS